MTVNKKKEKMVKKVLLNDEMDEREMVDETIIQRAERKMMEDYDGYPHTIAIREVFLQYLDKELAELYTVLPNGAVIIEGQTYERVWRRKEESPKYKAKSPR